MIDKTLSRNPPTCRSRFNWYFYWNLSPFHLCELKLYSAVLDFLKALSINILFYVMFSLSCPVPHSSSYFVFCFVSTFSLHVLSMLFSFFLIFICAAKLRKEFFSAYTWFLEHEIASFLSPSCAAMYTEAKCTQYYNSSRFYFFVLR